jgi:hypothetical protein
MARSTTARGYGSSHQKRKAHWRPIVDAGQGWCAEPICLMPSRWIPPGSPWHLAHGDSQGTYRGPAHARCNLAERNRRWNPVLNPLRGAARGMRGVRMPSMRGSAEPSRSLPLRTSRQW